MLISQADAVTQKLDGSSASEFPLVGRNRRGLVDTTGSQGRSSGSIISLVLFRDPIMALFYPHTWADEPAIWRMSD